VPPPFERLEDDMSFVRRALTASAALLIATSTSLSAQTMAPGPALPGNTGGVGPGGTYIAPGPAFPTGPIEQEGPGGIPLAAGPQIITQPHLHRHHRATRNAIHRTYSRRFQ
jgi:hypothetical protein